MRLCGKRTNQTNKNTQSWEAVSHYPSVLTRRGRAERERAPTMATRTSGSESKGISSLKIVLWENLNMDRKFDKNIDSYKWGHFIFIKNLIFETSTTYFQNLYEGKKRNRDRETEKVDLRAEQINRIILSILIGWFRMIAREPSEVGGHPHLICRALWPYLSSPTCYPYHFL